MRAVQLEPGTACSCLAASSDERSRCRLPAPGIRVGNGEIHVDDPTISPASPRGSRYRAQQPQGIGRGDKSRGRRACSGTDRANRRGHEAPARRVRDSARADARAVSGREDRRKKREHDRCDGRICYSRRSMRGWTSQRCAGGTKSRANSTRVGAEAHLFSRLTIQARRSTSSALCRPERMWRPSEYLHSRRAASAALAAEGFPPSARTTPKPVGNEGVSRSSSTGSGAGGVGDARWRQEARQLARSCRRRCGEGALGARPRPRLGSTARAGLKRGGTRTASRSADQIRPFRSPANGPRAPARVSVRHRRRRCRDEASAEHKSRGTLHWRRPVPLTSASSCAFRCPTFATSFGPSTIDRMAHISGLVEKKTSTFTELPKNPYREFIM